MDPDTFDFEDEPTERQLNYACHLMQEAGLDRDEIRGKRQELEDMSRSGVSQWIDEFKEEWGVE